MNNPVEQISDVVNTMAFDYGKFCEEMQKEHRTIQDNFTHLCVEWLLSCANENYRFDDRNYYSHVVGKKVKEAIKK